MSNPQFYWILLSSWIMAVFPCCSTFAQENEYFTLTRNVQTSRVSSGGRTLTKSGPWEKKLVGFVSGEIDFVLTGIYGISNPRIVIESESQECIEVEYSYGSEKNAFSKVVQALQLEETNEERKVIGWTLNAHMPLLGESVDNWPKDLFTGRKLRNGDTYSYLVKRLENGGAIYRRNGRIYLNEVTGEEFARFIEEASRKIVSTKLVGTKLTYSFQADALRGWQRNKDNPIGRQFSLVCSEITVPVLVVKEKHRREPPR